MSDDNPSRVEHAMGSSTDPDGPIEIDPDPVFGKGGGVNVPEGVQPPDHGGLERA
jgi:hypothetical protein